MSDGSCNATCACADNATSYFMPALLATVSLLAFVLFVLLVVVTRAGRRLLRKLFASKADQLPFVWLDGPNRGREALAPPLESLHSPGASVGSKVHLEMRWHIFLSHKWPTGQQQVGAIRERLSRLLPGCVCFLDVYDLDDAEHLEEYIQQSVVVLIFVSRTYFQSANCRREAEEAMRCGKPLLVVYEPVEDHGGDKLLTLLKDAPRDLRTWIEHAPAIRWSFKPEFQLVALTLIGEQLMQHFDALQIEDESQSPSAVSLVAQVFMSPRRRSSSGTSDGGVSLQSLSPRNSSTPRKCSTSSEARSTGDSTGSRAQSFAQTDKRPSRLIVPKCAVAYRYVKHEGLVLYTSPFNPGAKAIAVSLLRHNGIECPRIRISAHITAAAKAGTQSTQKRRWDEEAKAWGNKLLVVKSLAEVSSNIFNKSVFSNSSDSIALDSVRLGSEDRRRRTSGDSGRRSSNPTVEGGTSTSDDGARRTSTDGNFIGILLPNRSTTSPGRAGKRGSNYGGGPSATAAEENMKVRARWRRAGLKVKAATAMATRANKRRQLVARRTWLETDESADKATRAIQRRWRALLQIDAADTSAVRAAGITQASIQQSVQGIGQATIDQVSIAISPKPEQPECMMVLLLHKHTWHGPSGEALKWQVRRVQEANNRILLLHDTSSSTFREVWESTPRELIERGLYNEIATDYIPGRFAAVSAVQLARTLGAKPQKKDLVASLVEMTSESSRTVAATPSKRGSIRRISSDILRVFERGHAEHKEAVSAPVAAEAR